MGIDCDRYTNSYEQREIDKNKKTAITNLYPYIYVAISLLFLIKMFTYISRFLLSLFLVPNLNTKKDTYSRNVCVFKYTFAFVDCVYPTKIEKKTRDSQ